LIASSKIPVTTQEEIPRGGILRIEAHGVYTENFNPFSPGLQADYSLHWSLIYETLLYIEEMKNGEETPCLATGYEWSDDAKALTFTIREGVVWHDGEPFTPDDVAFTFNYILEHEELDLKGIGEYVESVTVEGNTVVFKFKFANVPALWYIADLIPIIPEHLWKDIDNPAEFTNPNPIGTGPFTLKSFSPAVIHYDSFYPDYWQEGKPYVDGVMIPIYEGNVDATMALIAHEVDWGRLFIADIDETFVAKDPEHNKYFFTRSQPWPMYVNLKHPILSELDVRKAIAIGIDRQEAVSKILYDYSEPSGPSGIVVPVHREWWNQDIPEFFEDNDPEGAIALLEGLGYERGSDGIFVTPDGERLSFEYATCAGWTDDIETSKLWAKHLKRCGIELDLQSYEFSTWINKMELGDFDLIFGWTDSGNSPYYCLNVILNSKYSAPIGERAVSNYGRWEDPETDQLLFDFTQATERADQIRIIKRIQEIHAENLPYIPQYDGVGWLQYQTETFVGWPSPENPYTVTGWGQTTGQFTMIALNVHLRPTEPVETPTPTPEETPTPSPTVAPTESPTPSPTPSPGMSSYLLPGAIVIIIIAAIGALLYRRRQSS
jgi:peptide/nickel transport system substrate-binding protein